MKKQKHHSEIFKINGVGVDLKNFYPVKTEEEKIKLRKNYGFKQPDFILIYTAEFIPRKNHKLLFDILPDLKNQIPELKVVLCGKGELLEYYKSFICKNRMDYVTFTGYTKKVADYCRISDVLVMPSFQEGLPMGMIEAIATGLPVVASNIRGNNDVIEDGVNGFLLDVHKEKKFEDAIIKIYNNSLLRRHMGECNIEKAKRYSVDVALKQMQSIYNKLIEDNWNTKE